VVEGEDSGESDLQGRVLLMTRELDCKQRKTGRRFFLVATAVVTLASSLTMSSSALAVEVAYNQSVFARFNNGHVGIVRIGLEKDLSNRMARAKVHVWCVRPGGAKVACDAIRFWDAHNAFLREGLSVQVWRSYPVGWFTTGPSRSLPFAYYTPPANGIEFATHWGCPGGGDGWSASFRAIVWRFRAAANDQWSKEKTRVSPTYDGTFC
jgi:hypothetical protein